MSFFMRAACCCNPCACPDGSPLIAGRGQRLGFKYAFGGVEIDVSTNPVPWALLSHPHVGGGISHGYYPYGPLWLYQGGAKPPTFPDSATCCEINQAYLDQGSDWIASGSVPQPPPDLLGSCDLTSRARCAAGGIDYIVEGFAFDGAGVSIRPAIAGHTWEEPRSRFSCATGMAIVGDAVEFTVQAVAEWYVVAVSPPVEWDDDTTTVARLKLAWRGIIFRGQASVPLDQWCNTTSVTVENQLVPGFHPQLPICTGDCAAGTDPVISGEWHVGSGGTVTVTPADCPSGGFGSFAAMSADEPEPHAPDSPPSEDEAFIQGVLDDAEKSR